MAKQALPRHWYASNLPANVQQRLRHKGIVLPDAAPHGHRLACFSSGMESAPTSDVLWLDGTARDYQSRHQLSSKQPYLSLHWQDSPFAVEYGFMLWVGGESTLLTEARPILDALAPQPGVWLYAGDAAAPDFLYALSRQVGNDWLCSAQLLVSTQFNLAAWQQLLQHSSQALRLEALRYLASQTDQDAAGSLAVRLAHALLGHCTFTP